ncbi:hypothetical protein E2C01_060459 [Portunus trituberculatus]|uniref:Uncharacterized protein n=1 Tax=Portunus trituberculatus TaxID=210409 RepID=A0A5B7H5B5_PORTR|nr:hypothetical protein [Portunus trituberculatus]
MTSPCSARQGSRACVCQSVSVRGAEAATITAQVQQGIAFHISPRTSNPRLPQTTQQKGFQPLTGREGSLSHPSDPVRPSFPLYIFRLKNGKMLISVHSSSHKVHPARHRRQDIAHVTPGTSANSPRGCAAGSAPRAARRRGQLSNTGKIGII